MPMTRLEEEEARVSILRNRVTDLEEDLEHHEKDHDLLVKGLEGTIGWLRDFVDRAERRWDTPRLPNDVRASERGRLIAAAADHLTQLLEQTKGGTDSRS
jgi:hypothetical protein